MLSKLGKKTVRLVGNQSTELQYGVTKKFCNACKYKCKYDSNCQVHAIDNDENETGDKKRESEILKCFYAHVRSLVNISKKGELEMLSEWRIGRRG